MLTMTSMNETVMLENFPLLFPSNHLKSWKGHISLSNVHSIYIEISCPEIPQLDNLNVCIPEFENFNLNGFVLKETVDTIQKKTHSLPEFLKDLISVLSKVWKQDLFSNLQNLSNSYLPSEQFYSLIQEVNTHSQFVHTIDENLKHITFNVRDICNRNHFITIYIPDEYPMVKKKSLYFETMIPPVTTNSLSKVNTVLKVFEEFKIIVDDLNNFWNVYEEIIRTCNVIGSYTYKDVNYRIPIDSHVYVEVEIDPSNPYRCPKFDLHGLPRNVEKFRLRLNEIDPIFIWNVENSFKENILKAFDIAELPSHYTDDDLENIVENPNNSDYCFICYDQLDTATKNQTKKCDNEKCDSLYHMACICEWLLNSGSTPMFKHLQGKCPQCEENMLVALDNFDLIKT